MDKLKAAVVQLKHKLADKKKEAEDLLEEVNKLKSSSAESASAETLQVQLQHHQEMSAKVLQDTNQEYEHDLDILRQNIADLEATNRLLNEDKQRKVSLEGQLESFEMTNVQLRDRIASLEESIAAMESEKSSLQREKLSLAAELGEKVNEFACAEDAYVRHANDLIEQDELIGRKLRETESDNFQLVETIKELTAEKNSLLQKVALIETQLTSRTSKSDQHISSLEQHNSQLQQQIQQLQADAKKAHSTHEQAIATKHAEIDEMEADLSSQLQRIENEKKSIQEALEKASDQIFDFQDEVVRLKDQTHSLEQARADLERELSWLRLQSDNYTQDQLENEQLRMQLMQSETEAENLRSQNESLMENHNVEIMILRQQITDLEAMRSQVSQNQTDDQVMLLNENVKLKELLVEKEDTIQQKSIQLQMVSTFDVPVQAVNDPFANLMSLPPPPPETTGDADGLEEKLRLAEAELDKLREASMIASMEMDMQVGQVHELLQHNKKLKEQVHEIQSMMDNLIRTNVELEASAERQKEEVTRKNAEINEIRSEMSALRNNSNLSTDDNKLQTLESELAEKSLAIEKLQEILDKYEARTPVKSAPVQSASAPFSTSMLFGDAPQASASSLFDDPFVTQPQEVVEEIIQPKKAYICFEQQQTAETQTEGDWLQAHEMNVRTIYQLQHHIQLMEQRFVEQSAELARQTEIINSYMKRIHDLESSLQKLQPRQTSQLFDAPPTQQPPQEVIEEVIQPKKAYLCFDMPTAATQTEDDWLMAQQENVNAIHRLQQHIQMIEQRFFEQSAELERQTQAANSYMQRIQELEPPTAQIQPTPAQFFDTAPSSQLAALEIEDGWGWGSAEASDMQQQVQQSASLLSPRSDMEVRLHEQRDIVERLEQEKSALNEELSNLRENSKKMMKKLKEYQTKIKELETRALRKSSSVESNDMDLVIQEELNSQIQKLEAKLKDFNSEKEKEHQEKEALLKRVDVLTSANERMTEMKERQDNQMELYQLKIRELSQQLHNLEEWGDDDEKKETPTQMSPMKENQAELLKKIQELNAQVQDMQVDYDELQALLDEEKSNNKILEERIVKMNVAHDLESSKDEEIERLSRLLKESTSHRDSLSQQIHTKDNEIRELISKIDLLCNESSNIKTILDDLSTQITLKTNENQELSNRLQKLETNNDELSRERQLYSDSVEQNFRHHAHDLEEQLQSLNAELQYKNSQIKQLNDKVCELSLESDQTQSLFDAVRAKDQEMAALRSRLSEIESQQPAENAAMEPNDVPAKRLQELEKANQELTREKSLMEHELQVLNDQVLASLEFEDKMRNAILELDAKNIEIQILKASLEKLQPAPKSEGNEELERLHHEKEELERSVDLLNAQWSQAVEQRGNEVANSWKQHLEIREMEFAELEASLRSQLGADESIAGNQDGQSGETIAKMRSIMESQEVEIVSLKEQLAIRSAEYAALSAKVDPYHQMSTSMNVSPIPSTDSDRVPRSELDLALYMLHQRDMRLEEMTMELVRLLEERDQLQLRLSNSIRQMEEVKRKISVAQEPESSDVSKTTTPEKLPPASANFEGDEQLRAKLSELHTVRHVRDKAIQDEREQRFMDNMTMLQRDVANIPPEAAARIVGKFALCSKVKRSDCLNFSPAGSSNQGSPSSVLMNWILGNKPESS